VLHNRPKRSAQSAPQTDKRLHGYCTMAAAERQHNGTHGRRGKREINKRPGIALGLFFIFGSCRVSCRTFAALFYFCRTFAAFFMQINWRFCIKQFLPGFEKIQDSCGFSSRINEKCTRIASA